jgi:hypothetical protein
MTRFLPIALPVALALLFPLAAAAQEDDLDWLNDDAAAEDEDEDEEEAEEDEAAEEEDEAEEGEEEAGAGEELEEEEEEEEKKPDIEISTDEPAAGEIYEQTGRLHAFLGLGYALPVIDLTGDGTGIAPIGGGVGGGLPIWFGGDFFFIDALATGILLRITPLFITGGDDTKGAMFDMHAQVGYHFIPSLKLFLGLGFTRFKAELVKSGETNSTTETSFSLGAGVSYTFYLTELGSGGLGLEVGAEYMMIIDKDFKSNPTHNIKGTVANNLFMYPLVFFGLRYSIAP